MGAADQAGEHAAAVLDAAVVMQEFRTELGGDLAEARQRARATADIKQGEPCEARCCRVVVAPRRVMASGRDARLDRIELLAQRALALLRGVATLARF